MRISKVCHGGGGILCALLAFALVMAGGCKTDEDDGGGGGGLVSPLSPPAISAVSSTSFGDSAQPVTNLQQARELFRGLTEWNSYDYTVPLEAIAYQLREADEAAQEKAFDLAYGDFWDWLETQEKNKGASINLNISDSTSLASEISNVTAGTITGSHGQSMSHSRLTLGELFNRDWSDPDYYDSIQIGDRQTQSFTANRTFSITGGYISEGSYKVSGIINIEYSRSWDYTVKEKVGSGISTDIRETGSTNDVAKVAVALLVSNGSRVAKFTFSTATSGTWNQRSADWSGGNNSTDVEVYNPTTGTRIGTIPAEDWYIDRDGFRDQLLNAINTLDFDY